jgi:hypothetical protein
VTQLPLQHGWVVGEQLLAMVPVEGLELGRHWLQLQREEQEEGLWDGQWRWCLMLRPLHF